MTVYLPKNHPALKVLTNEGIEVKPLFEKGDTNVCKIAFANFMGDPAAAEIDIARALSQASGNVELAFYGSSARHDAAPITIERNDNPGAVARAHHRQAFQSRLSELKDRSDIDGIILSGFPKEEQPLRQADAHGLDGVDFYDEFVELLDHIGATNTPALATCWSAHAALNELHSVTRGLHNTKRTGVFTLEVVNDKSPLARDLGKAFDMPVSRYGTSNETLITLNSNLIPIATSKETGVAILMEANGPIIYMTGHLEYGASTLSREYNRDLEQLGKEHATRPANYDLRNPQKTWGTPSIIFYNNLVRHFVDMRSERSNISPALADTTNHESMPAAHAEQLHSSL